MEEWYAKSVPYNINNGKMNITGLRDLLNGEKLFNN